MAKKKFTTTMEEDSIKKMKIEAIDNYISVGDLLELIFQSYMQHKDVEDKITSRTKKNG